MLKLWAVQWDGEATIEYDLLHSDTFKYRRKLGALLLYWEKMELQLEVLGRRWIIKRSGEGE